MIILNTTDDQLRLVLVAAHDTSPLQSIVSWRDVTTTAYTPGRTLEESNGATPVAIVPSPAASTQRVIDYVSVTNTDAVAHTLAISLHDGTDPYVLWRGALDVNERVEYSEALGWVVYTPAGLQKVGLSQLVSPPEVMEWQFKWLDTNFSHTGGTTLANIPGMSFETVAGHYYYYRFAANLEQPSVVGARVICSPVAGHTLAYAAGRAFRTNGASAETNSFGAYVIPAATSTPALAAQVYGGNFHGGEGVCSFSVVAAGGMRMQVASSSAATVVVKEGSVLMWAEFTP